ncbi:hypothetical protein [Actinophytocola sp.]|uniref:hypothetical protein n=1 Tax=Actinophytocola sp. TaxID=1872138 RepID=UPI003D6C637C
MADDQPGLIVLDLGLPDMDGAEVIRSVRAWSDVPFWCCPPGPTAPTRCERSTRALTTTSRSRTTEVPGGVACAGDASGGRGEAGSGVE